MAQLVTSSPSYDWIMGPNPGEVIRSGHFLAPYPTVERGYVVGAQNATSRSTRARDR